MVEAKFVIAIKKIEDGLYEIRYPDFPGLVSTVDSPEKIKVICEKIISNHLKELKEANKALVYPITYEEAAQSKAPEVELDMVSVELPEGLRMTDKKETVIDKEKLEETAKVLVQKANKVLKKLDNIDEYLEKIEKFRPFSVITGVLFIISVFFPLASVDNLFNGGIERIGLFTDMGNDADGGIYAFRALMAFMYVLILCSGIFSVYTKKLKSKFYIKAADTIAILLFFAFVLVFDVEIGRYFPVAGAVVGKSYMFLVLLIGALIAGFDLACIFARGDE